MITYPKQMRDSGFKFEFFCDQGGYYQHVMDHLISCTQRQETPVNISNIPKCKAVLVTSLTGEIIKAQGRHLDMLLIVFED
ncbi:fucosyltransferase [Arabidopsis thaliana]|uniref:Fucosyltransferase n=2 Tax=Arabidopsis thaliana TaxID=3702 RepID=Q9SJP5_ARATH|nr:fucosyltransferase [Arabidopsis thaliana]AAD22288.1 unknown protein [Arabidopsis thaliana]ABE65444.1 hypothetical protein At2g15360 [Arabidopsis thaliana]AEC06393.1 fucosyltransferase [Arabidopsis thaliana]|eukprot:NP_179138.1 fucosyltransferase [Arabidopsis thaliana]